MTQANARIYGFSFAQSLALTTATMSVAMSAIVGLNLASNANLSTLPYGAQFLGIVLTSYLMSLSMKRFGRKPIFIFASFCFVIAGLVGAFSIMTHSFWLNALSHLILGTAISGCAYFRFAVTDGLKDSLKSRALSIVTFGGIAAAFLGPLLVSKTRNILGSEFMVSYLMLCVIGLILMLLLCFIPNADTLSKNDLANVSATEPDVMVSEPHVEKKFPLKRFLSAIYASGFGYMLMGMLMMQSSLLLKSMGVSFESITLVIQCHVVAMFFPSLFMGRLINRYSAEKIIFAGYVTMFISIVLAINYTGYTSILIALIGIGLGWNMLYVGGSSMVALLPGDASKMQGINESAVAILQTIGAFFAGLLFSEIGWINSNWLAMLCLIPGFLLLIVARPVKLATSIS